MSNTQPVYRVAQIRAWEAAWFAAGQGSFGLMQQAALAVVQWIVRHHPPQPVTVLCGTGNNGGDGHLVALGLYQAGWPVQWLCLGEPGSADAQTAHAQAQRGGLLPLRWQPGLNLTGTLLVDAVLGIGCTRAPGPELQAVIQTLNQQRKNCPVPVTVLALDVPTGVDADTGQVWDDCAVRADATLCLMGLKTGLLTGAARDFVGQVEVLPLLPAGAVQPPVGLWHAQAPQLPPRRPNTHKGSFGHVLVVGGQTGMAGALLLAGEAALRAGAGKVTLAGSPQAMNAALVRCPALMGIALDAHGQSQDPHWAQLLACAEVLVVGMGLGRGDWGRALWQQVWDALMQRPRRVVLDADALWHLADDDLSRLDPELTRHWRLTPHPGEAARLLGKTTADLEADRWAAVAALQQRYGGQVLLKGAGSLVHDGQTIHGCALGNPGMATAGMGDVLAGLAGGLLAQFESMPLIDAVLLHAAAGDRAARDGQRGMTALDLLGEIRAVVGGERAYGSAALHLKS